MTTIAKGNTAEIYCPIATSVTFTPGSGGSMRVGVAVQSGDAKIAPQLIQEATTISVSAGATVFAEAIGADATYTTPAGSDSALSFLVSDAGILKLVPRNNVVLFGNSITGANYSGTGTIESYPAWGFFYWANMLLGQRFQIVANSGVSSDTLALLMARIQTDLIDHAPDYAVMCCLTTNDISTGRTAAAIIADLEVLYDTVQAAGIKIITSTDFARSASPSAENAVLLQVNDWIMRQQLVRNCFRVADFFATVTDPTSATLQPRTNYLRSDGIHPSALGAANMGLALRDLLQYDPNPRKLLSSVSDTYGYSSTNRNILDAGLMQGSNAAGSAGTSGFIPDGCALTRNGAGTSVVASIGARSDGYGNNLELACTLGAAADTVIAAFLVPGSAARFAVGDRIVVQAAIEVSGATNLRNVLLRVQGTTVVIQGNSGTVTTETGQYQGDWTGVARSAPVTVQSGVTALTASAIIYAGGAGAATVKIGRLEVRKLADDEFA